MFVTRDVFGSGQFVLTTEKTKYLFPPSSKVCEQHERHVSLKKYFCSVALKRAYSLNYKLNKYHELKVIFQGMMNKINSFQDAP